MEALFFIGKRTTLRPKRTSVGEKVEKLNFHVHVKDNVQCRVGERPRQDIETPSRFGRSVADTVVEELDASCI